MLDTKRGDPRHRSLYGAIDWSYQLLDPSQQLLLRRLAIFVGGFTLTAAEEVCTDDDVLAGTGAVYVNLAELVSKSLVMFDREQNRYRLLEPVRMFARERLDAHDETAAVAGRHANGSCTPRRRARRPGVRHRARRDIVADLDNVHAALDWLDATGDHLTFLRIVAPLGFTWFGSDWRRGRVAAARGGRALVRARPRLRGAVLLSRGIVEQRAELYESNRFFEEAQRSSASSTIHVDGLGDVLFRRAATLSATTAMRDVTCRSPSTGSALCSSRRAKHGRRSSRHSCRDDGDLDAAGAALRARL